ncbi:protein maelstrom homolog [Opisthocomus hoazin]|uniref:protein maelstrom homolog n=1 Tax=Opisthocomus hoazin TaxID=30419 RepID=UPI003F52D5A0
MAQRRGARSPFCCFVRQRLPELQRRGLPVARVADAIPHCCGAWALLSKEEKMVYAEKARKWNEKKRSEKMVQETSNVAHPVPACLTTKMPGVTSLPKASAMSWENDQAVVSDIFYFLDIYSHGKLPSSCEQRFLPCEIGCVKYSLKDGVIADLHHFIDAEAPPLGFRYHCQTASDATHKIPLSGFGLSRTSYAVVLRELLEFVQPARGVSPHFYCRSGDRFRIKWCLNRMASVTGTESHLELLAAEDLVIELCRKKYQKEPSRSWVCGELDVFHWDFSCNTRCKWHEENEILCCALASCKKIAYCISKYLGSAYGVSLTAAHLPLEDSDYGESRNSRMVVLDCGRFQKVKAEGSRCDGHFASPGRDQEFVPSGCDSPRGVKTSLCGASAMRGRGVTQWLNSAADLPKSFSH